MPYGLRSGKRGITVTVSKAPDARVQKRPVRTRSRLKDGENNSASASTRSPASDNLATESQCSVNQDDSNNLLNGHVVDGGVAHPFATDDGNQGFHSNDGDGFNQLEYNVSFQAISPQLSTHM